MQMRIVLGCSLHLRLPERQGEEPDPTLRVRGQMQLWPGVLLQEVVSADITPRTCWRAAYLRTEGSHSRLTARFPRVA
jgi:hypothetical protein